MRKQFCGYCGTHLTAWSESESEGGGEWLDVTLGSLEGRALGVLERMGVFEGLSGEDEGENNGDGKGDVEGNVEVVRAAPRSRGEVVAQRMRGRGMPIFEEMVDGGRLGRLKRQKGGGVSQDGRSRVEWEITEFEGAGELEDESMAEAEAEEVGGSEVGNKRLKMDG